MEPSASPFAVKCDPGFTRVLSGLRSSLCISVYQAGKILFITADGDKLKLTPVSFPKPMGISFSGDRMLVASKDHLYQYHNDKRITERVQVNGKQFDRLYYPRVTYHTGPLDIHDVAYNGDQVVAVNTRFSCISTFDAQHSFVPLWKPPFIDELFPEDRCHLNGMAVSDGELLYATALGSGNERQAWRKDIVKGGVLLSIASNEVMLDGLAMPHSPKIIGDYIYLLESAAGRLIRVHRTTKEKQTVGQFNGFVRGLTVLGDTAFIGISKVRENSSTTRQLPENVRSDRAEILAVDMNSGLTIGRLVFMGVIQEIYDIQSIRDCRSIGLFAPEDPRQAMAMTFPKHAFLRHPDEA